jgi:hypothetical protein
MPILLAIEAVPQGSQNKAAGEKTMKKLEKSKMLKVRKALHPNHNQAALKVQK